MITPTENFEFIGRRGWMINPRIFTHSPQFNIFISDRSRYREDYPIEFIDGSIGQSDYVLNIVTDFGNKTIY